MGTNVVEVEDFKNFQQKILEGPDTRNFILKNGCVGEQGGREEVSSKSCVHQREMEALQNKLDKANRELKKKTIECTELQGIRNKVEGEIEDLTTSLFEEANKMVYDANLKRHKMEKKLAETKGQTEALQTEVDALKSLVITSTPSNPNPYSHPQLIKKTEGSPFRSKNGKNKTYIDQPNNEKQCLCNSNTEELRIFNQNTPLLSVVKLNKEVNHIVYNELAQWHDMLLASPSNSNSKTYCECKIPSNASSELMVALEACSMMSESFMARVYLEDISLCLSFQNKELSRKVSCYVHKNSISVELASTCDYSQKCSLSDVVTLCKHRIRFDDSSDWLPVSQSCRNRITTVCDFLTYIRYIKQRIVKHTVQQVYWEINKLRMEMTLARLGYYREQL